MENEFVKQNRPPMGASYRRSMTMDSVGDINLIDSLPYWIKYNETIGDGLRIFELIIHRNEVIV